MVEDTVMTVTAFEGTVIGAVGVLVEVNSEVYDMLDILSSLTYKSMNSVNVVLEASCNEGIVLMVLYIIRRRLVNTCDTALSERRVAKLQVTLAEDKYFQF